ncbi:MAG: hypothetical protein LBP54_06260, partial [Campylobacteraceae bacterium]|nr:hypothetical protein [Campylobacteraceae bacterium]
RSNSENNTKSFKHGKFHFLYFDDTFFIVVAYGLPRFARNDRLYKKHFFRHCEERRDEAIQKTIKNNPVYKQFYLFGYFE